MGQNNSSQDLAAKITNFSRSMASRYLTSSGYSRRVDPEARRIRDMSCHGHGTELEPCPYREPSVNFPGAFICGACGCGDRRSTLLGGRDYGYNKLDFPFLSCPQRMPGFSNYVKADPSMEQYDRRLYIEKRVGIAPLETMADLQDRGGRVHRQLRGMESILRTILSAPGAVLRKAGIRRAR